MFVYEVKYTDTNNTEKIITVTVTGNSSTTIHGLIPGTEYTVTQKNDWSWRYGNSDATQTVDSLSPNGETVKFEDDISMDKWLDGNSALVKNRYTPTGG